jgi:F-type H+-transporting ATPase subunit gamma
MASLKDLKNRIKSVKSTQKITKAMKMVAAAKLRRAQEAAESGRPYALKMSQILSSLTAGFVADPSRPTLLSGNGKDNKYLVIVATSNRGLCGGFNSSIAKAANAKINKLIAAGKDVRIICVGRKGYDSLKRTHKKRILEVIEELGKKVEYSLAETIANRVIDLFEKGEFDVCTLFYNKFVSAISQQVVDKQLVPLELPKNDNAAGADAKSEFEPSEEQILDSLLPKNLAVQIYSGLLENLASEQGARMTAMDNATRNAGEMIKKLTLVYNRNRQAAITKELIEIISGAEAI